MDLASGARRLVVTMTHCGRDGASKVVDECSLPLTASRAVDVLITELAIFRFVDGEMWLSALMPGSTPESIAEKTTARYRVAEDLKAVEL